MRNTQRLSSGARLGVCLAVAALATLGARTAGFASGALGSHRLSGHLVAPAAGARLVGRLAPAAPVTLSIGLSLRDPAGLQAFLDHVTTPGDPGYGQYLAAGEFPDRFGPSPAAYSAVVAYARAQGLTVTGAHSSRLLVNVSGPSAAVENAFQVHLQQYVTPAGQAYHAPDQEPAVPAALASAVTGIAGLDNHLTWKRHLTRPNPHKKHHPQETGSGPGGGLTPSDIKTAYNLNGLPWTGQGQTLGLFELDGYSRADVDAYADAFGLNHAPLQDVFVDGFNGAASAGSDEVTLDIELQNAIAPDVNAIRVYQGPNADFGVLDTYDAIATEDLASSVSTSWGLPETETPKIFAVLESEIFAQMAAQGQSLYAASGDEGAYDDNLQISVDDPSSQPLVTGTGGTSLTTSGPGGAWHAESTWAEAPVPQAEGGGGGISTFWTIPSYQAGVITAASKGSLHMRNVPDVSMDSDPDASGYAIAFQGSWVLIGGTSCAAPLWAAFTALVNQARAANSMLPLGFASPALYAIGSGPSGKTDFHDIADGSTNLFYAAVTGYDDATGWGSFNGASLLGDLSSPSSVTPSAVQFSQPTFSVLEGQQAAVTVTRASGAGYASVTLNTSDGTALQPADYVRYSKSLEFSPGVTSVTTNVSTIAQFLLHSVLTVNLGLSNPVNLTLGAQATAVLNINPDPTINAPSGVVAFVTGTASITVDWLANWPNPSQYTVLRSVSGGTFSAVGTTSGATTTFTDTSVQAGAVTYRYEVFSTNASPALTSDVSPPSLPVAIPTGGKLKVTPTKLTFSGKTKQATKAQTITISNTGKGTLSGYVVPLSPDSWFVAIGGGSIFNLAPGKSLKIAVVFGGFPLHATDTLNIVSSAGNAQVSLTGSVSTTPE